MELPPTAAALQQFLCAANWVRDTVVDFALVFAPLQAKLEAVMATRGRRRQQLTGVELKWDQDERQAFKDATTALAHSSPLQYPSETATINLFCDASATEWAVVLTQVLEWDPSLDVVEQAHQLLVCQGVTFTHIELNWSVAEKEAYPIGAACTNLAHILDRPAGFRIFCDHANLIHIFAPHREVRQHIRGKLQRWDLRLSGFRCSIERMSGESNVWAYLVSRWAQSSTPTTAVRRVTTRQTIEVSLLRPLEDGEFVWPSLGKLKHVQQEYRSSAPTGTTERDGIVRVDDRSWVLGDATMFITRQLIVAHCGPHDHRGENVVAELLRQLFEIPQLRQRVQTFSRQRLLCKHVKCGHLLQRKRQEHEMATMRNECLHVDYLFLGDSYGDAHTERRVNALH